MSKLFRTALWIFSGLGLIGFISQTVITLLISPLMGIISILIAAILVAVVIALLRLSPMWARPARVWAPLAFLWGSGMAISLAAISSTPVMQLAINSGWVDSFMSWSGAYPEEISKAAGVLFVLMSFRQLNRPWHGWMVGAVVGLGFEANENILYGSMGATTHPDSDFAGLIQMWGLRLIAGPGLHVLLTALAGWGIGWALYAAAKPLWWRISVALGCLAASFLLHFGWNYLHDSDIAAVIQALAVAIILYPLSVWLILRGNKYAHDDDSYSHSTAEEALAFTR